MKTLYLTILSLLLLLAGTITRAAEEVDDIYGVPVKHSSSLYSGPVPYLVFGCILALLAYVGYRYMHDHAD